MTVKDRNRLDDTWSARARREGYPARSVYKLQEIDERHGLFRKGMKVLDLGASPGSWSLYAARATGPSGRVLGVDLKPLATHVLPNMEFMAGDVLELESSGIPEGPWDAVISDLAPSTSGRKDADAARSLELDIAAFRLARGLIRPGGFFIAKVFQGGDTGAWVKGELTPAFRKTLLMKPKAVRKGSVEIYVLGLGFWGLGGEVSGPGGKGKGGGREDCAD
ncbi:MAG: RlmE family RNA methyltransferase [Deltaproteobacteria bacterium]|jgi:23S rRNA (uridine2552-2'-O)-methyltransferase|nr:RlmE family RNA methyltransferase [Deltaproteobacteria bacterium]